MDRQDDNGLGILKDQGPGKGYLREPPFSLGDAWSVLLPIAVAAALIIYHFVR